MAFIFHPITTHLGAAIGGAVAAATGLLTAAYLRNRKVPAQAPAQPAPAQAAAN